MIGTIAAALAIALSVLIVIMPGAIPIGTSAVLPLLGKMSGHSAVVVLLALILLTLIAATIFRTRPGWLAASVLFGWFAILISQPFAVTQQQISALRRQARRNNEDAQAALDFYQVLGPFDLWLLAGITVFGLFLFVIGARRARRGAFQFLLDESNALANVCRRVGIAAAFIYMPMMIIIVYDVIQRKYLGWDPAFVFTDWYRIFTSTRIQEMQWHLHAVLFLLCLGYAYVSDAHVRIELVRDNLGARSRVWIELLGCLVFMVPYCYVILKYGIDTSLKSYALGERSSAQTGLDYRFIIKAFLPLGFAVLALAGMSAALKCVVYLFGPNELRAQSDTYAGTHHADVPRAEA